MKLGLLLIIVSCSIIYSQKNPDTLPVELIYFEAHPQVESILVKWGTATEIENFGFEVQRSTDLITFEVLEFIFGHGTSFVTHHYEYVDSPLTSGTYYYRLKQIDTNGDFKITDTINATLVTSVNDENKNQIINFELLQNYPNPFNPITIINYQLVISNYVELIVYDVLGNKVVKLVNEWQTTGLYRIEFDADKYNITSGIYYYQIKTDEFISTKKMIYLK